jgi:hypothetical protein
LVVDSNNVYWVNDVAGATVLSAPLTGVPEGGAPTTIYSGIIAAAAIAVDAHNVYWAINSSIGGIYSQPLGGGAVTTIGYGNGPIWMTTGNGNVYWATQNDGTIMVAAGQDSGTPVQLASPGESAQVEGIAVDSTGVYWTESLNDAVRKQAFDAGAQTTIATGSPRPYRVAVGPSGVYWTNGAGGAPLVSAPLGGEPDGGTGTTLASSGSSAAANIAIDEAKAYWTDPLEGLVLSVPLAGGSLVTIASGQLEPTGIAVDADYVYWTNETAGTVVKIAK